MLTEVLRKIEQIFVAGCPCDFRYSHIGGFKKLSGLIDLPVVNILYGRHSQMGSEKLNKIIGVKVDDPSQVFHCYIFLNISVDML